MKNFLSGFILLILFLLIYTSVMAIGVQPLTLDFQMKPGETEEFSIILSTSGVEEKVNLSIYQSFQDYTGNLSYRKADPESFPQTNWIKLEDSRGTVLRQGEVKINGTITVLFGTPGGSYTIILMVEPEPARPDLGVTLLVRYAVRIIVRVDGPGLREQGEIQFLDLQKDENGRQLITVMVKNTSQLDYPGKVEVTIRNKERSLLERLSLRTISARNSEQDRIRIYPGAELLFMGRPENYLFPGEYELRAFFEYGERGRKTMSREITIFTGEFTEPEPPEGNYLRLKPEKLISFLDPGQRDTMTLEIRSIHDKSIYLLTDICEIEPDFQYSLIPWMNFLNVGRLTKLEPHQLNRSLFVIQLPVDITPAAYYALLEIKVYADESMTELLEEKRIPVISVVGEEKTFNMEEIMNQY
ncbi:MAG: hypothetical protein GX175_02090 [Halanaerobiaceae bacterium]|nr:hypothetical protein [Halanaerobiaceae bacterium]